MNTRLHGLLDAALATPLVNDVLARRFDRSFRDGLVPGVCRGIYGSFEAAAAAAPGTLALGYDHDEAAELYQERLTEVYPGDYPMMFWLAQAFEDGVARVLDLGGHVGTSYYAYQRYLKYPANLRWQVLDVPAVAARGRKLAEQRDTRGALEFVPTFDHASSADLLFTSGCLQYLESSLPTMLAQLSHRPRRVMINLIPMHPSYDFWTVQSIPHAFCPYHVQRDAAFFCAMRDLGYELQDRWVNAEKRCEVKFHPEHGVDGYVGAVFTLPSTN